LGLAALADLGREEDDPAALARARALALAGERAAPKGSPGALACRLIVAEIEAPSYSLAGMASDAPRRRSIEIEHKNLAALHFRAYRLDPDERLRKRGQSRWPDWQEADTLLARPADASWTSPLPGTPDYRQHTTFVVPPLERGLWVVIGSARENFAEQGNLRLYVPMVIGDLVLSSRSVTDEPFEIRALAGEDGAPVDGAAVTLYRYDWQSGPEQIATGTTDAAGRVLLERSDEPYLPYFAVARHGGDVALLETISAAARREADVQEGALVYTDRSIYRPQQTVQWKILAYAQQPGGEPRILPRHSVTVALTDPNGQEVDTKTVATNDYGTAAGSFTVPGGRLLGDWSIKTSLRGEARYLFGLRVAAGRVRWQATREEIAPYWWSWWGWSPGANESQVVAAGEAKLEPDGGFTIAFTPAADERLAATSPDLTYRYAIHAEVLDEGGETREADRSFRLGFAAVEAVIDTTRGFEDARHPEPVAVVRRSLDGVARPGKGRWRLVELVQPATTLPPSEQPRPEQPGVKPGFKTPGDALRARWDEVPARLVMALWSEGREVAKGEAVHGADGRATLNLPALPAGAYRLLYATEDEFGARAEAHSELIFAGAGPLRVPAILAPERPSAKPGETLRVLVHGGWPGQRFVVERYRDGRVVEDRQLVAADSPQLLEFAIGDEDRGGLALRLRQLRDHQWMEESRAIDVPWDDRRLEVSFSSFRDRLRPGGRETWRVAVKGDDGAAVAAAELLAYMYDRSLDVFAPHHPPRALDLFPGRATTALFSRTIGRESQHWMRSNDWNAMPDGPELDADRLIFLDGWEWAAWGREC
jgi:hypothetical protein